MFSAELSLEQWNLVLNTLSKLSYEQSASTIISIQQQVGPQAQAAQAAAEAAEAAEAEQQGE